MSFYQENRPEQKRFYSTKRWMKCRDTFLSDHPLCERCLKVGRAVPAEHVHHKIELNENNYKDPLIALNPDNLEALCQECHTKEHHKLSEVGEGFCFDEDGNIFKMAEPSYQV